MSALGMRPLCDKVQIYGIDGEFCFRLDNRKKLDVLLNGRVVHVAGSALTHLETSGEEVIVGRLKNITQYYQTTFLGGSDPVLKIDFFQQSSSGNRAGAHESKRDEEKLPENIQQLQAKQSRNPSLIDDEIQYAISECTNQIGECVRNTDGGGIIEAIQALSLLPPTAITNPLTPFIHLINALSSDDAIFMNRRVKLEIAKQLRPFLHLIYVKNKEQMVTGDLCKDLHSKLKKVHDLLDKKSYFKGHIEDIWIRFEVETAIAGVQLLVKTSDKDERVAFICDLVKGCLNVINLINPIQAAISAAGGLVDLVQGLMSQDINTSGIAGVVGFLRGEVKNIANKEWYEKIVMLDLYKRCAINDLEQLTWMQDNLINDKTLAHDWQFDCAVVLALKEIIQQTNNIEIAQQAWAGTKGKGVGLKFFVNYPGTGITHPGVKVKLITARSLHEIYHIHNKGVHSEILKSLKSGHQTLCDNNVKEKELKPVLDTLDPSKPSDDIMEIERAFKKGFHKRQSKEEKALDQMQIALENLRENVKQAVLVGVQVRDRLMLNEKTSDSELNKKIDVLNALIAAKLTEEEQSKKMVQDIAKRLAKKDMNGQERIQAGIEELLQLQEGPELLDAVKSIQAEVVNKKVEDRIALEQIQKIVSSLDTKVADVLKAMLKSENGSEMIKQLQDCFVQSKKSEDALATVIKKEVEWIEKKQAEMEQKLLNKMEVVHKDLIQGQRVLEENQKVIQDNLKALVQQNPQLKKEMDALQAGLLKYHVDHQKLLRNLNHLTTGQKSIQKIMAGLDIRNQNTFLQLIQNMQANLQNTQSKEAQTVLKSLQVVRQTMEKNHCLVTASFERGQKEILENQQQIHKDLSSSLSGLREGQLKLDRAVQELSKSSDNQQVLKVVAELKQKQLAIDTKLDQFSEIYMKGQSANTEWQENSRIELQNFLKIVESHQQSSALSLKFLLEDVSKQQSFRSTTLNQLKDLQQGLEREGFFLGAMQENLRELSKGQERLAQVQDNLSHFAQEVKEEVVVVRNMVRELQAQADANEKALLAIQQFTKDLKADQGSIKGYLEGIAKEILQQKEEKQKKIEELRLLEQKIEESNEGLRKELASQVINLESSINRKTEQEEESFQKVSFQLMDMSKGQEQLFVMVGQLLSKMSYIDDKLVEKRQETEDRKKEEFRVISEKLDTVEGVIKDYREQRQNDTEIRKQELELAKLKEVRKLKELELQHAQALNPQSAWLRPEVVNQLIQASSSSSAKKDPVEQEKAVRLNLATQETIKGHTLFDAGEIEEAHMHYRCALSLRQPVLKDSDPELLEAYRNVRLCVDRLAVSRASEHDEKQMENDPPVQKPSFSIDTSPLIQKVLKNPNTVLTVEERMELLTQCIQLGNVEAEKAKNKHLVVFVGNTGAGKSTTINYLAGREMIAVDPDDYGIDSARNKVIIVNPKSKVGPMMAIGHGTSSQTFMPEIDADPNRQNITYCDCPGFSDTRGSEINIANAVNIRTAISKATSVRIVILADYPALEAGRGDGLKEMRQLITGLMQSEKHVIEHKNSILLGLTRYPFNSSCEAARKWIQEDSHPIMQTFADRTFIFNPLDMRMDGGWDRRTILDQIEKLTPITNPSNMFSTVLNAKDERCLIDITDQMAKKIEKEMKSSNFQAAAKSFHSLKQLQGIEHVRVDHLLERVEEHIYRQWDAIISKFDEYCYLEYFSEAASLLNQIKQVVQYFDQDIHNYVEIRALEERLGKSKQKFDDEKLLANQRQEHIDRMKSQLAEIMKTLEGQREHIAQILKEKAEKMTQAEVSGLKAEIERLTKEIQSIRAQAEATAKAEAIAKAEAAEKEKADKAKAQAQARAQVQAQALARSQAEQRFRQHRHHHCRRKCK